MNFKFLRTFFTIFVVIFCAVALTFSLGNFVNSVQANSSGRTSESGKVEKSTVSDAEINKNKAEDEKLQIRYISKAIGKILENRHYRLQKIDDDFSGRAFEAYLNMLDPNKFYFTAEDIAAFEPYRHKLDDEIRSGNVEFAFAVYDLYKTRIVEYKDFAEKELAGKFDFSSHESFVPDRRKLPRAANKVELKKIWSDKLKNDVLTMKLFDRMLAESDEKVDERQKINNLWHKSNPEEKIINRLRDMNNEVLKKNPIDILGFYFTAVSQLYGPHSSFMPPQLDEDFEINMSLSLTGIGATLTSDDGFIRVVELVPGGPAALDGRLKPEDRIIAVAQDGKSPVDVIDMPVSNAVKLIRGAEDTIVKLTVLPGKLGRNAVPKIIELKRAKVKLEDSAAKGEVSEVELNGKKLKVGIVEVPSFYMDFAAAARGDKNYRRVSADVEKIVENFKKSGGVDALVMDLRNNGGGSLYEAIELAGLFVKSGPVVQIKERNRKVDVRNDDDNGKLIYDGPLVILCSKLSASASEIFAGAIRDSNRGIVVGDSRSYGKGTVLTVAPLDRASFFFQPELKNGSLKYESACFYRINGASVQQLGISADIVLPSIIEALEIGEMFNDNHLPWDEIAPADYTKYYGNLDKIIAVLKEKSQVRVAASDDFKLIAEQAKRIVEHQKENTVSLNEEVRYKKYMDEKAVEQELDKQDKADGGKISDDKKRNNDVILNEAVKIAADFAGILNQ